MAVRSANGQITFLKPLARLPRFQFSRLGSFPALRAQNGSAVLGEGQNVLLLMTFYFALVGPNLRIQRLYVNRECRLLDYANIICWVISGILSN